MYDKYNMIKERKLKIFSFFMLFCIVTISGCANKESSYRSGGVGADLYSTDLAQATKDLETYFGFLCIQADLPTKVGNNEFLHKVGSEKSYPNCVYPRINSQQWGLIVQTGFNDIDRRCDGYLAWIEEARNRERFGRSQLNHLGALGNAIVGVKDVGKTAVTIVAAIFGYSKSLFDDYHELIYYGLESSTIKTIVMERRLDYRAKMASVDVAHKANAVNLLRSYLRICMPTTITMDANTYARSRATGGNLPSYTSAETYRKTLVGATFKRDLPANATTPAIRTDVRNEDRVGGENLSPVEQVLTLPYGKQIQRNLCVDQTGFFGPKTREAIRIAKETNQNLNLTPTVTDRLETEREANTFWNLKPCTNSAFLYRNIYEALTYSDTDSIKILADDLQTCAEAIEKTANLSKPAVNISGATKFDGNLRNLISYIKQNHPQKDKFSGEPAAEIMPANVQLFEVCE